MLFYRYVHDAGVDEPIVWYEGSGLTDRRHLFADHQGTIIASNDGATTTRYRYGPYGEPDAWGAIGSASRFRYTGQAALPEIGLYHYKARVYDPALGRFLQTDPVGYEDDLNLYAYVGNDPLNASDPTGMCKLCRSAFNIVRRTIDNRGDIRRAGLDEIADIASNVATVVDPSSSLVDRGIAVFDLVSPVTAREVGQVADAVGDAVRGADNAADAANASRRQVGSYTNTHESGAQYHGKGDRDRSQASGRRVERQTGDRHTATDWTPSGSDREAFIDESRRIDNAGGVDNPNNYNQIESPGRRYREEDGVP